MKEAHLIQDLLEVATGRFPSKTALICGKCRATYRDLYEKANRAAHGLKARGVQRGDRVLICLDNSVEAVAAIFGVLQAGAVFVPISPATKEEKLYLLLQDSGATALFCSGRPGGALRPRNEPASGAGRLFAEAPSLKIIIECDGRGAEAASGVCTWEHIQETAPCDALPRINIDVDLASILYTSGTTGDSKGVMSDHSNVLFALESISSYLHTTADDIILSVLPLSFGYGLNQVLLTIASGGTLVLEKTFVYPATILERMAEERVTAFPALPTIFALLVQAAGSRELPFVRYLTNAAAALPQAHIARLQELFPNAELFSMYGLTETTRALYLPPEELHQRPGSVGIAIPGTEVWIEDDAGQRVEPGEVGELVVRGRHVARGYWDHPAATQQRFRPGAVPGERLCYTGDLFRADADGFYYFVARKDDIIKSRGLKVPPRQIEEVLHRLEGVVEAAAFGVPDAILGQAIEAVLVTSDPQLTRARVLAHCHAHLEDFMVPRQVHFVPALPRTLSGKIRRTELPLCVVSPEYST